MGYLFQWDRKKAATNARKHGVTFEEASTAFHDSHSLLMPDPDHSFEEDRHLLLGTTVGGRLLVVSFVERPPATRLISAREANRRERGIYEEEN